MRGPRLIVTALAVALAAATSATSLATAGSNSSLATGASRPTAGHGYAPGGDILNGGPVHGMILVSSNRPLNSVVGDIPRLAADGVNLVSIYVTKYMDSPYSHTIKDGQFTPSDDELVAAISLAHANGMAVQLAPTIWSTKPYVWRGAFQPDNLNLFFANYRAMMNHYAELAQANGVELLTIGSEYNRLDGYAARWVRVAREVRARFTGLTTYMAVTQHVSTITWWRAVSFIGVSPYYPLSTALRPTYSEMLSSWKKRWFPFVKKISVAYNRPVLFNELGYVSALGATTRPWAAAGPGQPASQQVQADAYAAVLDGADSQPWLRGIIFFRWSEPTVAPIDRTYSPRDKLAECVMAEHWAAPDAPVGPDGRPVNCLGGSLADVVGLTG
jgi:hypothetical protein